MHFSPHGVAKINDITAVTMTDIFNTINATPYAWFSSAFACNGSFVLFTRSLITNPTNKVKNN